jgi:hypothetical protein
MPRVPVYNERQVQNRPLAAPRQEPGTTAAGGIVALGRGIQQAAGVFADLQAEERELSERAALLEADRALADWEQNRVDRDALSTRGKDAIGIAPRLGGDFDREASRIELGLKGDRLKLAFRSAHQVRRESIMSKLERHERGEIELYRQAETKASLAGTIEAAASNYADPQRLAQESSRAEAIIRSDASASGEPPELTAHRLASHRSLSHLAVLRAAASAGDHVWAEEYAAARRDQFTAEDRLAAEELVRASQAQGFSQRILGAFREDAARGVKALQEFDKRELPDEVRDAVHRRVNEGVNLLRANRRRERVEDLARVDRAIATDTAGHDTERLVDDLYASGALTPDEYGNTLARIDQSVIQRAKANAGAAEISKALAAGLPLDPQSKDQRDALSSYFAANTHGVETGSEPWRTAALAIANKTRLLPEQPLAWMRQSLRSPDPGIAATAAQFYGAVQAGAPDALSSLDDKTRSFADLVNSMIEAGTDPASAVEVARENVFQVREDVLKAREKAWGGNGHASLVNGSSAALTSLIDRDFAPGWFSSTPATSDARAALVADAKLIEPDFRSQTERYFRNTGDIERAREMAWNDVRRVYGRSEVNGSPQMFAFPPERYGLTRADIEQSAEEFLKTNPQADDTAAADVVLVPDAMTLRQVGDVFEGRMFRPSYALVGKSGQPLLNADGSRARFEIPSGEEFAERVRKAQAEAEGKARAQVDEARRRREVLKQMRENPVSLESSY